MAHTVKSKIIFPLLTVFIVAATTIVFYITQGFYMQFAQGQYLLRSQNYEQARTVLLEALKKAPHDIKTMQYIFVADEKLKNEQGAKDAYRIIEDSGTTDKKFSLYAADHYYSDAYYNKAERIYTKLLPLDERLGIKKRLAEVMLWQKKYAESIVLFEDLVKQEPENLNLQILLGHANFWAGHYAEAAKVYQPLLDTEVQTQEMVLNLAEALRLSGNDQQAVKIYDTYLKN